MTLITAQAALFDLDGVLVDSNIAVEEHWAQFARWYDLDEAEIVATSHGRAHKATIALYLDGASDRDIRIATERFETLEVEGAGDEIATPGAIELLASLPEGSYTVVTACWRALAEARAKAAGITLPKTVVTSDQVAHSKPAPDGYLLGAERLGFAARDCVVFEDSISGVTSAVAAGAEVVALMTTTDVEHLGQANHIVKDLSAVKYVPTEDGLSFRF